MHAADKAAELLRFHRHSVHSSVHLATHRYLHVIRACSSSSGRSNSLARKCCILTDWGSVLFLVCHSGKRHYSTLAHLRDLGHYDFRGSFSRWRKRCDTQETQTLLRSDNKLLVTYIKQQCQGWTNNYRIYLAATASDNNDDHRMAEDGHIIFRSQLINMIANCSRRNHKKAV